MNASHVSQQGQPVRPGQQAELRELHAALRTAYDIAFDVQVPSGEQAEVLVDALRRALSAARALSDPTTTGCPEHPRGAVDPLYGDPENPLPPGWGRCLLCNDRRRRASARRGGLPAQGPGGPFGP